MGEFFGAFDSVFPGTNSVVSDFSIIGFERNAYRTCLADISLKGSLHAKQANTLRELDTNLQEDEATREAFIEK